MTPTRAAVLGIAALGAAIAHPPTRQKLVQAANATASLIGRGGGRIINITD